MGSTTKFQDDTRSVGKFPGALVTNVCDRNLSEERPVYSKAGARSSRDKESGHLVTDTLLRVTNDR